MMTSFSGYPPYAGDLLMFAPLLWAPGLSDPPPIPQLQSPPKPWALSIVPPPPSPPPPASTALGKKVSHRLQLTNLQPNTTDLGAQTNHQCMVLSIPTHSPLRASTPKMGSRGTGLTENCCAFGAKCLDAGDIYTPADVMQHLKTCYCALYPAL